MRIYGDKYLPIPGKLKKKTDYFLEVLFESKNLKIIIPNYIIQNKINYNTSIVQIFLLPEWFLKKNRVIPLT